MSVTGVVSTVRRGGWSSPALWLLVLAVLAGIFGLQVHHSHRAGDRSPPAASDAVGAALPGGHPPPPPEAVPARFAAADSGWPGIAPDEWSTTVPDQPAGGLPGSAACCLLFLAVGAAALGLLWWRGAVRGRAGDRAGSGTDRRRGPPGRRLLLPSLCVLRV